MVSDKEDKTMPESVPYFTVEKKEQREYEQLKQLSTLELAIKFAEIWCIETFESTYVFRYDDSGIKLVRGYKKHATSQRLLCKLRRKYSLHAYEPSNGNLIRCECVTEEGKELAKDLSVGEPVKFF